MPITRHSTTSRGRYLPGSKRPHLHVPGPFNPSHHQTLQIMYGEWPDINDETNKLEVTVYTKGQDMGKDSPKTIPFLSAVRQSEGYLDYILREVNRNDKNTENADLIQESLSSWQARIYKVKSAFCTLHTTAPYTKKHVHADR